MDENAVKLTRRRLLAASPKLLLVSAVVGAVGSRLLLPEPVSAVAISGVTAVVSSSDGFLNLRTGPSTARPIIRRLYNGATVSVLQTSGDWFKVSAGSVTGWLNSWYVVLNGTKSQVITRGNTSRKQIALTFDAGSDLGYTQTIIETLETYGIMASFGLTGDWMNAYPDYAAWIAADGHQLLNHTLKHPSYTGVSAGSRPLSPAKRLAQIQANELILSDVCGRGSRPYWRPPYGDYDSGVLRDVGALGYRRTVMWTVDSMGWNGYTTTQITNRVMGAAGNGAIVLMHVGGASQDANALDAIIRRLRGAGYSFGTVAQVIAA
jgi:peptidoglycan/xylan/chitin deacetylase (PgdA/CDA1 family)